MTTLRAGVLLAIVVVAGCRNGGSGRFPCGTRTCAGGSEACWTSTNTLPAGPGTPAETIGCDAAPACAKSALLDPCECLRDRQDCTCERKAGEVFVHCTLPFHDGTYVPPSTNPPG